MVQKGIVSRIGLAVRVLRNVSFALLGLLACFLLMVLVAQWLLVDASSGKLFDSVEALPARPIGLVLGCGRRLSNGHENLFFKYRMNAAAEAFHAGKVQFLVVSGIGTPPSQELESMRAALESRRVPPSRIFSDGEGVNTMNSVLHAAHLFGDTPITVISQRFQNRRALLIARAHGINAIGFDAADVALPAGWKTRVRELFSKVKVVFDVLILQRKAKFQERGLPSPQPIPNREA